jgi:LPS-assembly protein
MPRAYRARSAHPPFRPMRHFRLHPLGVCALVAFAPAATASDTPAAGLRLQPGLLAPPLDAKKDPVPVFIDADELQGRQDREVEARGRARLRKRNQSITADWLLYVQPDDEVEAAGNVRIEQNRDVFVGPRLKLKLDTERGFMQSPVFTLDDQKARGSASVFHFEGENRYRAEQAKYTTCGPGDDDWYIRAAQLDIDRDRQVGTAHNASVVFMDTPILYSPWLDFSLNRERKSGFLAPSLATSGKSGAEFSIPYYWNIAPNRDATFTPHVLSKRGLMVGSEFRYLEPRYQGEARLEILQNDQVRGGENRHAAFVRHQQTAGPWSLAVDARRVSDDNYFRDLATRIESTSQVLLPRQIIVGRGGSLGNDGVWGASAMVQRYQTLQDPLAPVGAPYNRQPQIVLQANKYDVLGTDVAMTGSFVDFNHPTAANGRRWVAYPTVSLPIQLPYAYVTPKFGVHLTRYQLDSSTTTIPDASRTVPIFSVETGLVLERDTTIRGQNFTQTLEPKLYYVRIPTRKQAGLPNFESGVSDIGFATIFNENQFSGDDRINDANQVTLGVTSRLLTRESGVEQVRVGVAQRFYFKDQEVTLPGVAPRSGQSSDLLAALSGTIAPGLVAEVGWQHNTDSSQTRKLAVGARYQPDFGKVLNVGYRFARDSVEQIDISGQWPIARNWTAVGRVNYSARDRRLVEALAGAEYNGGCWMVRVVTYTVAVATGDAQRSVFVQLELNGVSSVGSNPLEVLKRNISGYSILNEPQRSSLPPTRWGSP